MCTVSVSVCQEAIFHGILTFCHIKLPSGWVDYRIVCGNWKPISKIYCKNVIDLTVFFMTRIHLNKTINGVRPDRVCPDRVYIYRDCRCIADTAICFCVLRSIFLRMMNESGSNPFGNALNIHFTTNSDLDGTRRPIWRAINSRESSSVEIHQLCSAVSTLDHIWNINFFFLASYSIIFAIGSVPILSQPFFSHLVSLHTFRFCCVQWSRCARWPLYLLRYLWDSALRCAPLNWKWFM